MAAEQAAATRALTEQMAALTTSLAQSQMENQERTAQVLEEQGLQVRELAASMDKTLKTLEEQSLQLKAEVARRNNLDVKIGKPKDFNGKKEEWESFAY